MQMSHFLQNIFTYRVCFVLKIMILLPNKVRMLLEKRCTEV